MDAPRTGEETHRTLASQPAAVGLAPGAALDVADPPPALESLPAPHSAGASRTRLEQMLLMARQMRQH